MSRINDIVDSCEILADKGYPLNEYQKFIKFLEALDVIADIIDNRLSDIEKNLRR